MSTDCKEEIKIEIEKPRPFHLKEWRIENGFITEEWNMYRNALVNEAGFYMVICFVAGVVSGMSLFVG